MFCFLFLFATQRWDGWEKQLLELFKSPHVSDQANNARSVQFVGDDQKYSISSSFFTEQPYSKPRATSHMVFEHGDFFFKELDGADESPENEFICQSFFQALGIPELIAPTVLIEITDAAGDKKKYQVSRKVGEYALNETPDSVKLSQKDLSWHFIMTLLLNLGDGTASNYRVTQDGRIISIDNEMILRELVVFYPTRGALSGLQSVFLTDQFAANPVDKQVYEELKKKGKIAARDIFAVLELLMGQPCKSLKRDSILYCWCQKIIEHNKRYGFLDPENGAQKFREELWWKLLAFAKRWNDIIGALEAKPASIFADLSRICLPEDLFTYHYQDQSEKRQESITQRMATANTITKRKIKDCDTGLKVAAKERLRYKLCHDFLAPLLEQHAAAAPSSLSLVEEYACTKKLAVAQFIRGLLEENKALEKAKKSYKQAAKQGNFYAQNRLGLLYENVGDYKSAQTLYSDTSATGNFHATYRLARMYEKGWGVEKDLKKAFVFYEQAAEQGNYFAQYRLAQIYEDGLTDKKKTTVSNGEKAFKYYEQSAKAGHLHAQYKLAKIYRAGRKDMNVELCQTKASEWFEAAAHLGHFEAQWECAQHCKEKKEQEKWYRKSFETSKKLAEPVALDEKANFHALFLLGEMYYTGVYTNGKTIVPKKRETAFEYYEKAAELGNYNASWQMYKLSKNKIKTAWRKLYHGQKAFKSKKYEEALKLFQEARRDLKEPIVSYNILLCKQEQGIGKHNKDYSRKVKPEVPAEKSQSILDVNRFQMLLKKGPVQGFVRNWNVK